jgi:hypothetical protein
MMYNERSAWSRIAVLSSTRGFLEGATHVRAKRDMRILWRNTPPQMGQAKVALPQQQDMHSGSGYTCVV